MQRKIRLILAVEIALIAIASLATSQAMTQRAALEQPQTTASQTFGRF